MNASKIEEAKTGLDSVMKPKTLDLEGGPEAESTAKLLIDKLEE